MSLYIRSIYCLLAIVFFAAMASAAVASSSGGTVNCDRVASPSGSDINPGSESLPYRTAQHLADSLSTGQTGCLRSGTYAENVKISAGGSAGSPMTVRSYPDERARVVGRLWIAEGADFVSVSHLDLDGTNATDLPSPTINANDTSFTDNDVTNGHTSICFVVGSDWGRADRTVIERNRIHDCGRLPATNYDHGIYVELTRGSVIQNNLIYDNADRGIQLYPDAQQSIIRSNVIDGNGEGMIFSGDGGVASSDNKVEYNIITNSTIRNNVEAWYPIGNPIGTGNTVRMNCIHGGARDYGNGGIQEPQEGFTATDNLNADPLFVNRSAKNFHLQSSSPCLPLTGDIAAQLDGNGSDPGTSPDPGTDPNPDSGTEPAPDPVTDPVPDERTKPGKGHGKGGHRKTKTRKYKRLR